MSIDQLGHPADGIVHLLARLGFQDDQHIPDLLRESRGLCEELEFDADTSRIEL